MYTTNLRKVGGSIMLAVPPALLELLHLSAGVKVGLHVNDQGQLIIEPKLRARYSLDQLLLECGEDTEPTAEDRQWLGARPVGDELL